MSAFSSAILTNWKTTLAGVVAGLMMILGQAQNILDEDTATNIDWNVVATAIGIMLAAIAARDSDVTSEKSRAK